jgi:hypothetical protein
MPYLVLYTNVVAGDYSVLRISASGQTEFTNYNALNQILQRGQKNLEAEETAKVFQLLENKGFFGLNREYDVYPQKPADSLVYEDVYYWLKASTKSQPERVVVAHEKARPANLMEITAALSNLVSQLPPVPMSGTFILAGDAEILCHKRPSECERLVQLDDQTVQQYPELEQALRMPFSLITGERLANSRMGQMLKEKPGLVQMIWADKHLAVLLLEARR